MKMSTPRNLVIIAAFLVVTTSDAAEKPQVLVQAVDYLDASKESPNLKVTFPRLPATTGFRSMSMFRSPGVTASKSVPELIRIQP